MTMAIAKAQGKFVETEIDDEVVLMDLESGNFFSLAGTSLAVWRAIDGERSADQIAAVLADEYDQPLDRIIADVTEFLGELQIAGLIEG